MANKTSRIRRCVILLFSIHLLLIIRCIFQPHSPLDSRWHGIVLKLLNSFAHAPINRIALSPPAKTLHKRVRDIIQRLCIRHTKAFLWGGGGGSENSLFLTSGLKAFQTALQCWAAQKWMPWSPLQTKSTSLSFPEMTSKVRKSTAWQWASH